MSFNKINAVSRNKESDTERYISDQVSLKANKVSDTLTAVSATSTFSYPAESAVSVTGNGSGWIQTTRVSSPTGSSNYFSDNHTLYSTGIPFMRLRAIGNNTLVGTSSATAPAVHYSKDNGRSWQLSNYPAAAGRPTVLKFINGQFLSIGEYENRMNYSSDGVSWSRPVDAAGFLGGSNPNISWRQLEYGNGRYVMMGHSGTASDAELVWSTDGVSWTAGSLPVAIPSSPNTVPLKYSLIFASGVFLLTVAGSSSVYISSNAITWTQHSLAETTLGNAIAATYFDGMFVIVSSPTSSGSARQLQTANANNPSLWTSRSLHTVTGGDVTSIVVAGDTLSVQVSNSMLSTKNLTTWSFTSSLLFSSSPQNTLCYTKNGANVVQQLSEITKRF